MKINIPKVIVPVNMAEYAPELTGKNLYVWVNPPMEKLQAYNRLMDELRLAELAQARQILQPDANAEKKDDMAIMRIIRAVERWWSLRKQDVSGLDRRLLEWYVDIWSQGTPDTHWCVSELRELESQDPTFLTWMVAQTWKARSEHIEQKKKV